jgi:hypothetical protein
MAQTQTQKTKGFRSASASRLPKLACTGYVAAVYDGRESKSGNYNTVTVEINGFGGSKNTKVYPCTRPEWFAVDEDGNPIFRPDSLKKVEGGKSIQFVYASNIKGEDGVSTLEGLAGSEERFDLLTERLLTDARTSDPDKSAEAIASILEDVLVAGQGEEPFEIGYILKQQAEKSVDKNGKPELDPETGKPVYIYKNRYEIDEFFEATEKNKKRFRKQAEKSAEKAKETGEPPYFKVTFDDGTPF